MPSRTISHDAGSKTKTFPSSTREKSESKWSTFPLFRLLVRKFG